jgi:spermidine/putrescine transport system permease protein
MVFAFLYLPIALLVVFSFNSSKLNILWEGFSTKWYEALLTNKVLITAFENSIIVARRRSRLPPHNRLGRSDRR